MSAPTKTAPRGCPSLQALRQPLKNGSDTSAARVCSPVKPGWVRKEALQSNSGLILDLSEPFLPL